MVEALRTYSGARSLHAGMQISALHSFRPVRHFCSVGLMGQIQVMYDTAGSDEVKPHEGRGLRRGCTADRLVFRVTRCFFFFPLPPPQWIMLGASEATYRTNKTRGKLRVAQDPPETRSDNAAMCKWFLDSQFFWASLWIMRKEEQHCICRTA